MSFLATRASVKFYGHVCRLSPASSLLPKTCIVDDRVLIKNSPNHQQIRTFKSNLKIKWVRPEKIPCIHPSKSGDLKPREEVEKSEPILALRNSKELASANDLVKRIFSLEFYPEKMTSEVIRKNLVSSVHKHNLDFKSMEARIAYMTGKIRCMQEIKRMSPGKRVALKELIDKRKKYLKFLRKSDYKMFEWLLEKLDIVYHPPPSHFHWITRKESLVKLTDKHCEDIKMERLKAYREVLESQKIDFLSEKIDKLQWIMKEEAACGVEPTVSQDDIDKVVKQVEELKIKKGIVSIQQ